MNETRFYNQARFYCETHKRAVDTWENVCSGHTSLDEAVTCQAVVQAVLHGQPVPSEFKGDAASLVFLASIYHLAKAMGHRLDMRLVKQEVVSEEICG